MATWVVEGRYPAPSGTWYGIGNFYGLGFRKEVNAKWTGQFTALTPIPPAGGLKLHYDMEKLTDAGLMEDLSGSGFHGTITATTDVAGKYGRARTFADAANNNIDFGDLDLPLPFTLAAWIKPDATQTDAFGIIFNKMPETTPTTGQYRMDWVKSTTKVELSYHDGVSGRTATSATSCPAGSYTHVAVILKASGGNTDVTFVINGVAETPQVLTGQGVANNVSGRMGTTDLGGTSVLQYKGDIDEPYIYGRALSAPEILDLKNASAWDLLQNNNEVRFRETGAGKEWFRGRIRTRVADEVSNEAQIGIVDNSVMLYDAKWQRLRVWTAVAPLSIVYELASSAEGEPMFGQVLRYNMETRNPTTGRFVELSGNNDEGYTTSNNASTGSVNGRMGAAWHLIGSGTPDTVSIPSTGSNKPEFTGRYSLSVWLNIDVRDATTRRFLLADHFNSGGNSGYQVELKSDTTSQQIVMKNGDGLAVTTATLTLSGLPFQVGVWTHLAVVYDQMSLKASVDGGAFQTVAMTRNPANASSVGFVIGGATAGTVLDLVVDEYYLFNRDLSIAEILVSRGPSILAGGVGTVDALTSVGFRGEDEQRLNLVDALARLVGGEWYVDRDGSDKDRINLVARIGSGSPTDTFTIGTTAVPSESVGGANARQYETDSVVNDWIVAGNDGVKQLKSRNFQATTLRTTLTADLTAAATTATVADTTGWPSTGNVYIGMERCNFTGKTSTTLTGLTRAYSADGYPSLAAYAHNSGIEVWLHSDNDATPDVYYTATSPQNGSSIKRWGYRANTYSDQTFSDQNGADRFAQRLSARFKDPRESVILDVLEETVACDIGDSVTVNDENGAAYFNSPYRVFATEYSHDDSTWRLELGNYRDTFERRVAEVRNDSLDAMYYTQAATAKGASTHSTSSVTITTTTEKVIASVAALGVKAGQKIRIRGWGQLQTGTGTTTVAPAIRRGSLITDVLVGNQQAENVKAAAGSTEPFYIEVDEVAQKDDPTYSFTLKQAGATGNGTVFQSRIEVSPIG